jgi:hypothetical protein
MSDGLVNVVRRDLENHLPRVAGAIAVVFDDEHTMRRKCRRMANPCPERSVITAGDAANYIQPAERVPLLARPGRGRALRLRHLTAGGLQVYPLIRIDG